MSRKAMAYLSVDLSPRGGTGAARDQFATSIEGGASLRRLCGAVLVYSKTRNRGFRAVSRLKGITQPSDLKP